MLSMLLYPCVYWLAHMRAASRLCCAWNPRLMSTLRLWSSSGAGTRNVVCSGYDSSQFPSHSIHGIHARSGSKLSDFTTTTSGARG